jgi:Gas vesicle synthesis protein GvpL/GvpF
MADADDDLRWATEMAPRLREQARAEALEEARARLRERLVDALLATADPPTVATADPPAVDPPLGLWLYGVMSADAAAAPERYGVDSVHEIELIRHAGLAALVSAVPLHEYGESGLREALEDLEKLEVLACAHELVLDEALQVGAVVPFRICTIYASPARVEAMLAREREPLTAALRRLRGMAEWGVKGFAVSAENDAEAGEPASGTEYLARRRDERAAAEDTRQALDAAVGDVHARLRERAADAMLSPPQASQLTGREAEMVLNGAYLVADADVDDFHKLVAELDGLHRTDGVQLELTGPWPAYHFTEAAAR